MRKVFFIAAMLSISLPAPAKSPLEEARAFYKDMEYRKAVRAAGKVLIQRGSLPDEVVEAYLLMGLSLAAEGKIEQSREAFQKLLALEPEYTLAPQVSPKLSAVFYMAKAMAPKEGTLVLEQRREVKGKDLAVTVQLKANPFALARAVVIKYGSGERKNWAFAGREFPKPGEAVFILADFAQKEVGYVLEVLNEHGAILKRFPSGEECYRHQPLPAPAVAVADAPPTTLTTPPSAAVGVEPRTEVGAPLAEAKGKVLAPPAWYASWWFWTAVGIVVAAGGITTGVLLGSGAGSGQVREYNVVFR